VATVSGRLTLSRSLGRWARLDRWEPLLLGLLGLALLPLVWEVAADQGWLNPVTISSPTRVAAALQRELATGELQRDLLTTMFEFSLGMLIACIGGVGLGVLMGFEHKVEAVLAPFMWFVYSAPMVAFYPLMIVWLGFGLPTVLAIIVLLTAVPVALNTLVGVRDADPLLKRAVRSFGAGRWDVVRLVVLPSALPMILAGLRIGAGRALIGVVLGEMFSANAGLGYRLIFYGARLRTADVLVQVLVITVIGVIVTQVIQWVATYVSRWRQR
jgi:NitT/TauT family transport system permease protein